MKLLFRILFTVVIAAVVFFAVTFAVYFFNLDMKLTALIEPFLQKHYDRIDRDTHL